MELHRKKLLVWHRVEKPIQAIDNENPEILFVDKPPNSRDELSRRQFGGINLLNLKQSTVPMLDDVHSQTFGSLHESCKGLVEGEDDCLLSAISCGHGISQGDCSFAASRRAHNKRTCASVDAPSQ